MPRSIFSPKFQMEQNILEDRWERERLRTEAISFCCFPRTETERCYFHWQWKFYFATFENQIYEGGFAPQRARHPYFATPKLESFLSGPGNIGMPNPQRQRWIPAGFVCLHFTIDGAQPDKVACFLSAEPGLNEFGSMSIASFSAFPKCLGSEKGYKPLCKDSMLPSPNGKREMGSKAAKF